MTLSNASGSPGSSSGRVSDTVEQPEVGQGSRVAVTAEEVDIAVEDCGVVAGARLRNVTSLRQLDPGRCLVREIERPEIGGVPGLGEPVDQPNYTVGIVANQRGI